MIFSKTTQTVDTAVIQSVKKESTFIHL